MESQMKSSQNLSNRVLDFINGFKEKHPLEIEDVFSNRAIVTGLQNIEEIVY